MKIYKLLSILPVLSIAPFAISCSSVEKINLDDIKPFSESKRNNGLNDKPIVSDDWNRNYEDINNSDASDRLVTFSSNQKNILFFFSDEVTGEVVSQYLKEDRDNIASNFTGATVYRNIVSSNFTNIGIPRLNGGWDYNMENQALGSFKDIDNGEVLINSYDRIISMMNKYGYQQQWHDVQYFQSTGYSSPTGPFCDRYKNKIEGLSATTSPEVTSHFDNVPNSAENRWYGDQWDSLFAKQSIYMNMKTKKTKRPVFKWIGGEATHSPFKYQNNSKPEDRVKYSNYATGNSDESTFTDIRTLSETIKKLKENNIYDSTMIIYVSDHGTRDVMGSHYENKSGSGTEGLVPIQGSNDYRQFLNHARSWDGIIWGENLDQIRDPRSMYRLNPTLIIKPWNATNNVKFDDTTLLGNADVPAIIKHEIKTKQYPGKPYNFDLLKSTYQPTVNMYSDNPLNEKNRQLEVYPTDSYPIYPHEKSPRHNGIKLKLSGQFYDPDAWQYANFGTQDWKDLP